MSAAWPGRAEREATLARLEARLRAEPDALDVMLDRARLLVEVDRLDDARAAYVGVLERAPDHLRALADFGTLLVKTGYRAAARTVYERAVALAPQLAHTHLQLANVLFMLGDYPAAADGYRAALRCDPGLAVAHQGLSYALTQLGAEDEARAERQLGFGGRALSAAGPYRGSARPIDVLVLVSAAGGTFYTDEILDDRIFRTTTLAADLDDGVPLPPHDVVLNAISDADRAANELARMEARLRAHPVPVVNAPAAVLATARAANARRLGALDGVMTARVETFARVALAGDGGPGLLRSHGFAFPLLLRAPGYHTGAHFARVDEPAEIAAALASFPGEHVLAIEYIDVAAGDGTVRKYRMMCIDGRLYPLHVAIARDWKVHYFTADMAGVAEHRAEDERFLNDPAGVLGPAAMAALARVRDALGLDYAGIDFALDRAGRVVVFEANATMIVLPPGPDPMWDYRRAPTACVIAAAQAMLRERAGR